MKNEKVKNALARKEGAAHCSTNEKCKMKNEKVKNALARKVGAAQCSTNWLRFPPPAAAVKSESDSIKIAGRSI